MYYVLMIFQKSQTQFLQGKQIVEELEKYDIYVDIKTVYSTIKNLNDFFRGIFPDDLIISRKKSGFKIQKEFFSDGELQFLIDSIAFHQDLRSDDKNNLKDKLLCLSTYQQRQRLVFFDPIEKDFSFSLLLNLSTIMKAIENENVISFQYINYEVKQGQLYETLSQNGNNKDEYYISPYQIVSQNNHYYVIGYNDKYKNQLATYRIDRMRVIQTTRQRFIEVREQFDMRDEIAKMTNMFTENNRDTLKIECHQKILREVVSHFGQDLKAEKLFDDHFLVTIENIPFSEGLIGWIMMLQDQIKVVEPIFLQQDIKNRLKKISCLYEN